MYIPVVPLRGEMVCTYLIFILSFISTYSIPAFVFEKMVIGTRTVQGDWLVIHSAGNENLRSNSRDIHVTDWSWNQYLLNLHSICSAKCTPSIHFETFIRDALLFIFISVPQIFIAFQAWNVGFSSVVITFLRMEPQENETEGFQHATKNIKV